jgi:hypothetical protein
MQQIKPILLFNDECAVRRRIGHWVQNSAHGNRTIPVLQYNRLETIPRHFGHFIPASIFGMPMRRSMS